MPLQNITDAKTIFTIEAARYSFILFTSSHRSLESILRELEAAILCGSQVEDGHALRAIESVWQMLDMGFRFGRLLGQIRGLKQKDVDFQITQRMTAEIEYFRNIFQHLNSHIPQIIAEVHPIMGVVSWVSATGNESISIGVGTQPSGVSFHSIPLDQENNKFTKRIVFSAGNKDIDLDEALTALTKGHTYLTNWLTDNNHLNNKIPTPTFAILNKNNLPKEVLSSGKRYIRMKVNTDTK